MTSSTALADRSAFTQVLIGRDDARAVIDRHLREAKSGHGSVVLVEGPAGLGRTRLLEEAVASASVDGYRVGSASATPDGLPMAPLLSALFDGAEPLLERPSLADVVRLDPSFWSVSLLSSELEQAARRSPLLLCIDDLQAADRETAAALAILTQRLLDVPVVWMLSRRPCRTTRAVNDLVALLMRHGAETLALGPLDEAAISQLTAALLGADPTSELLAVTASTGGNPSMLVDLLRGLAEEGSLRISDGRAELVEWRIPHRIDDRIRSAVGRASPRAHDVAVVAAVLGTNVSLDHLAAMLVVPSATLLAPVDELVEADLLVDDAQGLAFRCELVRKAVTELVAPSVSRALRLQAIDVLLDAGASPIQPAQELASCAVHGDRAIVATLAAAARPLGAVNPRLAAQLLRVAFDVTAAGDERRPSMAADLGTFLHDCGRPDEARAVLEAVVDERLAAEDVAMVRLAMAQMTDLAPAVRIEAGEASLALHGVSPTLRADHASELVLNALESGCPDRVGPLLTAAEGVADAPHEAARWALAQAILAATNGYVDRARADLDGLRSHRNALPPSLRRRVERFDAELRVALGDHPQLGHTVISAIAEAERDGQVALARSWRRFQGRLLLQCGPLPDADAAIAGELDGVARVMTPDEAQLLLTAGELAIHAGDARGIRAFVEIAERTVDDGVPAVRRLAAWLLVLHAETSDDIAVIRDRFDRLGSEREVASLPVLMLEPTAAPRLVRMALRLGLDGMAVGVATAAVDLERRNPASSVIGGAAAHSRGLVDHDPDALTRAAELFGAASFVVAQASAIEDSGVELARRGERAGAIETLDVALHRYAEAGASWDASRVRRRLRTLGVRRRLVATARPVSGWASLTAAELAVVQLVVDGLTNSAVAKRLYLSPHTVSMHLRHVFLKLGINSRVELTRLAMDRDKA